jgi:hypothetical protein
VLQEALAEACRAHPPVVQGGVLGAELGVLCLQASDHMKLSVLIRVR